MIYKHNNALRATLLHDDTAAVLLHNILMQMEQETFGLRKSERLVGGAKKLSELVESGAVRYKEDNNRIYYNAHDVLLYCRSPKRRKEREPRKFKKIAKCNVA